MRTIYALLLILSCIIAFNLHADELEDFEKLFDEVKENFDDAVAQKNDSRFTSEYEKKLSRLEYEGRRLQQIIVRLGIKDINIAQEVTKLKQVYHDRKAGKRVSGSHRIGYKGGRWQPISELEKLLKQLKDMKFSAEDRSIEKEEKYKDEFEEFEELLNYCSRNIYNAIFVRTNTAWKRVFTEKMARFVVVGGMIQEKLNKKKIKIPLAKEVGLFADCYRLNNFSDREKRILAGKKKSSSNEKDDLKEKKEELEKEIAMSTDRLREYIIQLKDKGFVFSTSKAKKKAESDKEAREKKESEGYKEEEVSYVSMSKDELFEILQKERDRIYKADTKMGGLSKSTVSDYVDTLTKRQKKHYSALYHKYRDRNHDNEESASMAIKEIHGLYRNRSGQYTKEDIIKILEKVDRSKKK